MLFPEAGNARRKESRKRGETTETFKKEKEEIVGEREVECI